MTMWLLRTAAENLPWPTIAAGVGVIMMVCTLVSYMTKKLTRFALIAMPIAAVVALVMAGRSEAVPVEVVREIAGPPDRSEIERGMRELEEAMAARSSAESDKAAAEAERDDLARKLAQAEEERAALQAEHDKLKEQADAMLLAEQERLEAERLKQKSMSAKERAAYAKEALRQRNLIAKQRMIVLVQQVMAAADAQAEMLRRQRAAMWNGIMQPGPVITLPPGSKQVR